MAHSPSVVRRWRARLVTRQALLAAARKRHSWRPNNASRALVHKRRSQVEEAQRVIARHTEGKHVHTPVDPIVSSSWGYHPGVHDGVDLITEGDDDILAICDGTIIRAATGGWWGKGARASGGHSISDGDGVIVLRCAVENGPFKSGLNFVYGHAEHPTVRAGQRVKAGQKIGRAGFANAWHIHFCVNDRSDDRGVGDRDPMPFVNYARSHD